MSYPPSGPAGPPQPVDPSQPTPPDYSIPAAAASPATGPGYQVPPQPVAPSYPPAPVSGPGHSGYPADGGYPQPTPPAPAAAGYPNPAGYASDSYSNPTGPTSTPPFAGQVSGPPMSGDGVPAAGYPGPVSGLATPGGPYGPVGSIAPKKSRAVLVLAIVAGLLLVFGGVMTGLFVAKSNELTSTKKDLTSQVAERDATIAANQSEIEKLQQDLATTKDELEDVRQDLTGTENQREELERQKKVISDCLNYLAEASLAAEAGNRTAYESAMAKAEPLCKEAERYL